MTWRERDSWTEGRRVRPLREERQEKEPVPSDSSPPVSRVQRVRRGSDPRYCTSVYATRPCPRQRHRRFLPPTRSWRTRPAITMTSKKSRRLFFRVTLNKNWQIVWNFNVTNFLRVKPNKIFHFISWGVKKLPLLYLIKLT